MALRPFIPVIISKGGGGNTLSLFQEKPSLDDDEDQRLNDDVNTTLALSHSASTVFSGESSGLGGVEKKRKLYLLDDDETLDGEGADPRSWCSDPHVYNPMPLRWYMPNGGEISNLGFKKMKKNKKPRRNRNDDVIAVPSIEEFPELMQAVESLIGEIGRRPDFSYSKKLEGSDVKKYQSRLFLTNGEEEVVGFLNAAEKAAIESDQGLRNIVGVDERGNKYYDLKMKKWPSLNMTVINSDWNKMVAANNAEKGDLLHIWGFRRRNGKLALAVAFRKQ